METTIDVHDSPPPSGALDIPEGILYDLQFDCPACGVLRPVAIAISGEGLIARCEACGDQVPRILPVQRRDPERDQHPYEGLG